MITSMEPKIAVVLGGTFPHRQLLKNLKRRGYRTLLVDYHEYPCALDCADEHLRESTLDVAKVEEIARTRNAELVISSCIDQANLVACEVSEQLGLPHPYSTDTAKVVTNKPLMKKFMVENGIPTSGFVTVGASGQELSVGLSYPLIVKPADSNSSKGIVRVDSPHALGNAVSDAIKLSRTGEAVVEEFVEGQEIGIDCFVHDDASVSVLVTKQRRKIPQEKATAQQIYGCIWPADVPDALEEEIFRVASDIAKGLGIRNCPLMIQAIAQGNKLNVIEFAARFGGGESCTIIEAMTGVDIIDLSINSFLGEQSSVSVRPSEEIYAETFLYARQGIFDRVDYFPAQDKYSSNVLCLNTYKTSGMPIGDELSSNNRAGAIIVRARNVDEVLAITEAILPKIDIKGTDGNSIFRREVY